MSHTTLMQIFKGHKYTLWIPQIQYIFKDYWHDYVSDDVSRNGFQGLNFCGMRIIYENSNIYALQKFVSL